MKLKARLKMYVSYRPTQEEIDEAVTAAWRFAFGVMQPRSVCNNFRLLCVCDTPDLLNNDCEWHGKQAQRMCA